MKQASLRAWLLLVLIFLVGGVTGAAVTILSFPLWHSPPGEQLRREHWMAELTRRLDLTPQQQQQIAPIVNDAERQIQSVHRDELGDIGAIFTDAYTKMAPLLTAQQQPTLAEIQRESRQHGLIWGHFRNWNGPQAAGPSPAP